MTPAKVRFRLPHSGKVEWVPNGSLEDAAESSEDLYEEATRCYNATRRAIKKISYLRCRRIWEIDLEIFCAKKQALVDEGIDRLQLRRQATSMAALLGERRKREENFSQMQTEIDSLQDQLRSLQESREQAAYIVISECITAGRP